MKSSLEFGLHVRSIISGRFRDKVTSHFFLVSLKINVVKKHLKIYVLCVLSNLLYSLHELHMLAKMV